MTYEEALQIAIEELDEKIEHLSDTFKGFSAKIEGDIYSLSMARKALMQELKDAEKEREWVALTGDERSEIRNEYLRGKIGILGVCDLCEAKLKEKNSEA